MSELVAQLARQRAAKAIMSGGSDNEGGVLIGNAVSGGIYSGGYYPMQYEAGAVSGGAKKRNKKGNKKECKGKKKMVMNRLGDTGKAKNPWVKFVLAYSAQNNVSYGDAMKSPAVKRLYAASKVKKMPMKRKAKANGFIPRNYIMY